MKGYSVVFFAVKDGNNTAVNVTLENGDANETILVNLLKYTKYSIRVLGFTERDKKGPLSSAIFATTDQDGKKLKGKSLVYFKLPPHTLNPQRHL